MTRRITIYGPIDQFEIEIYIPPGNVDDESTADVAIVRATCHGMGFPEEIQKYQQLILAPSDLPKLRDQLISACESFGLDTWETVE